MKISAYLFLATTVLLTSIMGCRKKEETKKANPDITLAKDTGEGKTTDDADINILNDQAQTLGGAKKTATLDFPVGTNITRSITTSNGGQDTTWTITIDFGNSTNGLYCAFDGFYRKGKIIYHLTEQDATFSMTGSATFQDYYVGKNKADIKREGDIAETYGINGSLQFQHTYQVKNAKMTRPDGKFAMWSSDHVGIWKPNTSGTTPGYYEVKGSGNGTTYSGAAYDYAIDQNNPLVYEQTCVHPKKGIMTLTDKNNNKKYTFDYNTGNCNTVNITVDGQTQTMNIGLQ
jgi:hypothetical protein